MRRWFHRTVLARRWATFLVMGLSFLAFGVGSLNLFNVARANLRLITDHGWMAVMDGGGLQLFEVLVTGYLSTLAYLIFKACEYSLVHWLGDVPHTPTPLIEKAADENRHPAR